MIRKIEKVREEIRKEEARIREMTEHVKTLKLKEQQLVNEEIVNRIRSMTDKDADILDTLKKIQDQNTTTEEQDDVIKEEQYE